VSHLQVPIAKKCLRVLIHLNEITTAFLHDFVEERQKFTDVTQVAPFP
jgi:hypothetical protein